jgi:hypothetical protein
MSSRSKLKPLRKLAVVCSLSVLTALTTACSSQELHFASTYGAVGADHNRVGVTLCANGVEFRDAYGHGRGLSDFEVSLSGFQLNISFQEHTFAGPSTSIRERMDFSFP